MASVPESGLRREQAEINRLAWAFGISLLVHCLTFGVYEAGHKLGLWRNLQALPWLKSAPMLTRLLKNNPPQPPPRQELPIVFLDVNPIQATPEPPKNPKFYSNKNSVAANPDTQLDTDKPKIDGKQTEVPKTVSAPREKFAPLQPSPSPQTPQPPAPEERPKPAEPSGEMVMAKAAPERQKEEGESNRSRPKTVREALARLGQIDPPGEKSKQEGGVRRHLSIPAEDVKATMFGDYDAALIEAIRNRWFGLLDERDYASDGLGKVVLQFRLHSDGRISDMTVAENTAGEVLGHICQRAVMDPAPFSAWTLDMRRMLGDTRNIQFTFYYH